MRDASASVRMPSRISVTTIPGRAIDSPSPIACAKRALSAEAWPLRRSIQRCRPALPRLAVTRGPKLVEIGLPTDLAPQFEQLPALEQLDELRQGSIDRSLPGWESAELNNLGEQRVVEFEMRSHGINSC